MNRFKEAFCVILGHVWNETGSKSTEEYADMGYKHLILEHYRKCDRCGLEEHNRNGHLVAYRLMQERWLKNKSTPNSTTYKTGTGRNPNEHATITT